ncbi:MAG: NADP-dependent oxidoreductase, partial [Albidovulum sp.]
MPTSRRVVLAARPDGIPQAQHFRIEPHEPPALKPGEILVRNQFLSVEPAMRG